MQIIITTVLLDNKYWTYRIFINGNRTEPTSAIYRMYDNEVTALNNGVKRLPVEVRKYMRSLKKKKVLAITKPHPY